MKLETCSRIGVLWVTLGLLHSSWHSAWVSAAPASPPPPAPDQIQEKAPLILLQGEQRLLSLPGLARYSLGGSALRAVPLPSGAGRGQESHLLLKALTPGSGDLWVWKKDGTLEHRLLHIRPLGKEHGGLPFSPALSRALDRLTEVEVLPTAQGALLRGAFETKAEAERIASLLQGFPGEVRDRTQPSEALLSEALTALQAWLGSSNPASDARSGRLRVERREKTLRLLGSIEDPEERRILEAAARSIYPLVKLELSSLPDASPTVHFRVFLLELKRSQLKSFGLGWPAAQEGAFRITPSGIHNALDLEVALQALESEGSARILSKPELVVRAPGEAELFAGGELPIRTQSQYFSDVSWKSYGLMLKLKVTHTTERQVRLDIFTEISHLDRNIETESKIPGLQANRMKTQVDAHYGSPLLLSGLLQQGTREAARGLPLLRRLPVLGPLFGSEEYLNERSELVAILLPSLTPPATEGDPAPAESLSYGSASGASGPPTEASAANPPIPTTEAPKARAPGRRRPLTRHDLSGARVTAARGLVGARATGRSPR